MSNFLRQYNPKSKYQCNNEKIEVKVRGQRFLKPFNKLAVGALSSLKHSALSHVLNLMKHFCLFIKNN